MHDDDQQQPAVERRVCTGGVLALEERGAGRPYMRGHAAVFDTLSEDLGGFREQIVRGAFQEAIGRDDVRLLVNHDGLPLARTASKTLTLKEDERGLYVEAELDAGDPDVQRLMPKMKRGDLTQMSFAFRVMPGGQDWAKDDEGRVIRTLKRVRLFDVSVVTFPAYAATDVAMRSLRAWQQASAPDAEALRRLNLAKARTALAAAT